MKFSLSRHSVLLLIKESSDANCHPCSVLDAASKALSARSIISESASLFENIDAPSQAALLPVFSGSIEPKFVLISLSFISQSSLFMPSKTTAKSAPEILNIAVLDICEVVHFFNVLAMLLT